MARTVRQSRSGIKPGWKILLIAGTLLVVFSFGTGLVRIGRLLLIKQDRTEKLEEIKNEKQFLETEIERLTSDSLYIEEIARKEYGMVREGEEVFHLTLPDSTGDGD